MKYVHIAQRILNTPLAIDAGKLDIIMGVLAPRLGIQMADRPALKLLEDDDEEEGMQAASPNPALNRVGGDYRINTKTGIAVIEVNGSLVNRYATAPSGIQSYDEIRTMLRLAAANEDVKGILLRIDSYGGEVSGMWDTMDEIAAIGQVKPVWASVDDAAYSAAYGIASQASKIYTTRTAGVGSVGVIAVHYDRSAYLDKQGIKATMVFAGKRKADFSPNTPLSDEALAELTGLIERNHMMFVAHVAKGRGMLAEHIRATESGRYEGEAGVAAGFADHVGTFDEALDALSSYVSTGAYGQSASMKAATSAAIPPEGVSMEQPTTIDVAAIQTAATNAERSRIATILKSAEAQTRSKAAIAMALDTDMSSGQALAILGTLPEQSGNGFLAAMGQVPNPEVRPNAQGEPSASEVDQAVAMMLAHQKGAN